MFFYFAKKRNMWYIVYSGGKIDMKFKMNNIEFTIKEVSQEEMKHWYKDDEREEGYYYGQTHFTAQEVWLDKSLSKERKRKTLMHELMHCYIREYLTTRDITPDEEVLCDLSANSHDIIHEIVEKYFKSNFKLEFGHPDEPFKLTPEMLETMADIGVDRV